MVNSGACQNTTRKEVRISSNSKDLDSRISSCTSQVRWRTFSSGTNRSRINQVTYNLIEATSTIQKESDASTIHKFVMQVLYGPMNRIARKEETISKTQRSMTVKARPELKSSSIEIRLQTSSRVLHVTIIQMKLRQ